MISTSLLNWWFGADSVNMKMLKTKCNQKCRDNERHYFRKPHTGASVQEGVEEGGGGGGGGGRGGGEKEEMKRKMMMSLKYLITTPFLMTVNLECD